MLKIIGNRAQQAGAREVQIRIRSACARLDAVPTNGTLHLRAMRPAPETEG